MDRNYIISKSELINLHNKDTTVRTFVVTPIETNCYAVINDGKALVIDPGTAGAEIAKNLSDVHVEAVVATHAHGDHVSGVKALIDSFDYRIPFALSSYDERRLETAVSASNLGLSYDDDPPMPDVLLKAGEKLSIGDISFKVLHTPGHTDGGIVLYGDGMAFTGDTLFKGSAGRTDFPGGDRAALMRSLEHLRNSLPPETLVFPGHGLKTSMQEELHLNPFLA